MMFKGVFYYCLNIFKYKKQKYKTVKPVPKTRYFPIYRSVKFDPALYALHKAT
jgi:hypothetical protein